MRVCGVKEKIRHFACVAFPDDAVKLATSRKALEQVIKDPTAKFREQFDDASG